MPLRNSEEKKRGNRYFFQIDHNVCVQFKEQKLTVHPYIFGAWLGDGSTTKGCVTYAEKDSAVIDKIVSLGHEVSAHCTHKITGVHTDYFKDLHKKLKKIGVIGNKFIPDQYLFSSASQRKELLAGLIDTDGSLDKQGRVRIVTASLVLASQIRDLVISLGQYAYIMQQEPSVSTSGIVGKKIIYTVGFNYSDCLPTAIMRKATGRIKQRSLRRAIVSVKKVEGKPGHCIQVEGGIYLAGETMIPTHNSFFISQWLPVWFLSMWPHKRVLLSTYEANFAATWGRRARNIIKEKGERVGLFLADDATASNNWATTEGGGMVTAGVGGPITGKGCDLGIIDDPHKNWQEAQSPTILKSIHEWFDSTFYTRLEPRGTIVILHTRWSENDLIGYLSREKISDGWFLIRIPAIGENYNGEEDPLGREEGEALCPQRYDEEALNRIKSNMTAQMWNALFQQRPAPQEGSIFLREKWKYYRVAPKCTFILQSWDTASKTNWDSAYSVCQTWGISDVGAVLLGQWRDKVEYPQLRRQAEMQYSRFHPNVVLIEDKDSGKALIQALRQETTMPVLGIIPDVDKVIRAQAVSPMQESGRVWLPDPTDPKHPENLWVVDFVDNCTTFPNSFFKDEIDTMSQALAYIMLMATGGKVMSFERRKSSLILEDFRRLM